MNESLAVLVLLLLSLLFPTGLCFAERYVSLCRHVLAAGPFRYGCRLPARPLARSHTARVPAAGSDEVTEGTMLAPLVRWHPFTHTRLRVGLFFFAFFLHAQWFCVFSLISSPRLLASALIHSFFFSFLFRIAVQNASLNDARWAILLAHLLTLVRAPLYSLHTKGIRFFLFRCFDLLLCPPPSEHLLTRFDT